MVLLNGKDALQHNKKQWSVVEKLVGDSGFEPETPVLSGLCSNQLS